MEKHIQTAIDDYVTKLKEDIKNKALALQFDDTIKVAELIQYTFDYQRLTLQKNDFLKRKRVQNSIPEDNRCIACRANGCGGADWWLRQDGACPINGCRVCRTAGCAAYYRIHVDGLVP
jgi:hypothetical protein